MNWLVYVVVLVAGYLLGSLPTGYLVARARGVDIRGQGSGNIGATNVFRVLGRPAGTLVMVVDVLKGVLASAGVPRLALAVLAGSGADFELARILGGVAAVLGHNYTCWLGFKGGKGVATTGGVLLGLIPGAFAFSAATWLIVFGLSRYVSLASLAAAVSLPVGVWFTGGSRLMIAVIGGLGLLAIVKHRSNIRRLLNGTEHRFQRKPAAPVPP